MGDWALWMMGLGACYTGKRMAVWVITTAVDSRPEVKGDF